MDMSYCMVRGGLIIKGVTFVRCRGLIQLFNQSLWVMAVIVLEFSFVWAAICMHFMSFGRRPSFIM